MGVTVCLKALERACSSQLRSDPLETIVIGVSHRRLVAKALQGDCYILGVAQKLAGWGLKRAFHTGTDHGGVGERQKQLWAAPGKQFRIFSRLSAVWPGFWVVIVQGKTVGSQKQ